MPPVRHGPYIWTVRLFLGDQCDWYITGKVVAANCDDAIMKGQLELQRTWPSLNVPLGTFATASRIRSV